MFFNETSETIFFQVRFWVLLFAIYFGKRAFLVFPLAHTTCLRLSWSIRLKSVQLGKLFKVSTFWWILTACDHFQVRSRWKKQLDKDPDNEMQSHGFRLPVFRVFLSFFCRYSIFQIFSNPPPTLDRRRRQTKPEASAPGRRRPAEVVACLIAFAFDHLSHSSTARYNAALRAALLFESIFEPFWKKTNEKKTKPALEPLSVRYLETILDQAQLGIIAWFLLYFVNGKGFGFRFLSEPSPVNHLRNWVKPALNECSVRNQWDFHSSQSYSFHLTVIYCPFSILPRDRTSSLRTVCSEIKRYQLDHNLLPSLCVCVWVCVLQSRPGRTVSFSSARSELESHLSVAPLFSMLGQKMADPTTTKRSVI